MTWMCMCNEICLKIVLNIEKFNERRYFFQLTWRKYLRLLTNSLNH